MKCMYLFEKWKERDIFHKWMRCICAIKSGLNLKLSTIMTGNPDKSVERNQSWFSDDEMVEFWKWILLCVFFFAFHLEFFFKFFCFSFCFLCHLRFNGTYLSTLIFYTAWTKKEYNIFFCVLVFVFFVFFSRFVSE